MNQIISCWKGVGLEPRSEDSPGQTPFLKIGPHPKFDSLYIQEP